MRRKPSPSRSGRQHGHSLADIASRMEPRVLTAGRHPASPGWCGSFHFPRGGPFDLWFVQHGHGTVWVNDLEVSLCPGRLLTMTPEGARVRVTATRNDPWVIDYVHLDLFSSRRSIWNESAAKALPTALMFQAPAAMGACFEMIVDLNHMRPAAYELRFKEQAVRLLILMLDRLEQPRTFAPSLERTVSKARMFIDKHFTDPLTLDQIAAAVGGSRSHLCTAFRVVLQSSPIQYQLEVRMRQARLMLARHEPIGTISQQLGFSSASYFSRVFHQHHGMSPRAFATAAAGPDTALGNEPDHPE